MAEIKHSFWEGCNVRPLMPLDKLTKISRQQFWENCDKSLKDTMKNASKMGLDPSSAKIKWTRIMSESSLFYFCVVILGMDFINHDFGFRLCLDVQQHKWERMWIIAREHYKSTIITCASTLWEICKDPNRTYCIYSYKQEQANKFLNQIKSWIKDRAILRYIWSDIFWEDPERGYQDLPDGTRIKWTWKSSAIELKRSKKQKEMTIETGGIIGSSKTGGHFSHQIFDDCETPMNVQTPEAIETLFQAISMATNTGQTENLNTVFIGTFYAKADAYTRMIKEKMVEEAIVQSCYEADGTSVHYSDKALEKKRKMIGSVTGWATQMLCDPSLSAQNTFSEDWIKFWPAKNFNNLNLYTFVDPASDKTGKKHDWTVMWTIGFNNVGHLMCVDIRKDKMTFEQKWKNLVDIKKMYNPIQIFYEEVGMQSDRASLEREMERANFYFTIDKFSPIGKGDKSARIEKLVGACSRGEVWFPEFCYHQCYTGEVVDMIGAFIREEVFGYPNIVHEDGLDALSMAVILRDLKNIVLPDGATDVFGGAEDFEDEDDDSYDPMDWAVNSKWA